VRSIDVYSMTGYALQTAEFEDYTVNCEIKSLNNKYLEIKFRLPPYMTGLENSIRKSLKVAVKRGNIEVYIRVDAKEHTEFEIIKSLLMRYYGIIKELEAATDFPLQASVSELLAMRNILGRSEEYSFIDLPVDRIMELFEKTLGVFNENRYREGENTKIDISRHVDSILTSLQRVEGDVPTIVEKYKSQIKGRIVELLNGKVDETRLMMEVGIFAGKVDISEEITRIQGHIKRVHSLIRSEESCGRELDFTVQELFREINTIGSKVPDYAVSEEVVNMKTALEKIREQVRNIE
jgi:uncharacterized protein (TIGR00255 family)